MKRAIDIDGKKAFSNPVYLNNAMLIGAKYLEAISKILEEVLEALNTLGINQPLANINQPLAISRFVSVKIAQIDSFKTGEFDVHQLFNIDNMTIENNALSHTAENFADLNNLRTVTQAYLDNLVQAKGALIINSPFGDMSSLRVNIFGKMINFADTKLKSITGEIREFSEKGVEPSILSLKYYQLDTKLFKALMADKADGNERYDPTVALDSFIELDYLRLAGVCKNFQVIPELGADCSVVCFKYLTLDDICHHRPQSILADSLNDMTSDETLKLMGDHVVND